jgi:threonine/homoserine/homoserine lactone efflux protein
MTLLLHAALGMVLSFIGSIPFGSINVTVMESSITRGFRTAIWVIFGAACIEFIQAFVALKFSALITRNPVTEMILFWASIPILIAIGIYFVRQKNSPDTDLHGYSRSRGFLKGIIIAALNVLAIPYWIFYGSYLTTIGLIDLSSNFNIVIFSLGVFSGTIIILMVYAKLGVLAKAKFSRITHYIAPAVGYFFFLLALIQIGRGTYALFTN